MFTLSRIFIVITISLLKLRVISLTNRIHSEYIIFLQERKLLIDQVEQAQKLQTEAEKEADTAMSQLEEFINEQERLVSGYLPFLKRHQINKKGYGGVRGVLIKESWA